MSDVGLREDRTWFLGGIAVCRISPSASLTPTLSRRDTAVTG